MDKRVHDCPDLTEQDIEFLRRVEAGLALTADLSRADILLCTVLAPDAILVARHMSPQSTSSLYGKDATGRVFTPDDQPLLFRTIQGGNSGRGQKEVLPSGAPIIQDCYPIHSEDKRLLGAMVYETNMVAYERHRRRNRLFRQAVRWLQEMCIQGELTQTSELGRFSLYDGVYLVDRNRKVVYMNGIVANMFRSIGIVSDISEQRISTLEPLDEELVEQAFHMQTPIERRHESSDGRIWIRTVIPLQMADVTWQNYWQNWSWYGALLRNDHPTDEIESVLVTIHNATDAVQTQRELNVKSAIIQEVHHRVKNNLQTVAAILRIQARRTESEEAKQALMDAVNRILSMSVIHEFLSQDDHRPINVRDVCQRVANQIVQVTANPGQQVDVKVSGPNVHLPAGQATPMALVINELMLNAMEHGVGDREKATIVIILEDKADAICIQVEDEGDGVPLDFDPTQSQSLGLQIVHTLVTDDLKGALTIESYLEDSDNDDEPPRSGTRANVSIPKRPLAK